MYFRTHTAKLRKYYLSDVGLQECQSVRVPTFLRSFPVHLSTTTRPEHIQVGSATNDRIDAFAPAEAYLYFVDLLESINQSIVVINSMTELG
jgi:hypothetical protein